MNALDSWEGINFISNLPVSSAGTADTRRPVALSRVATACQIYGMEPHHMVI